MVVSRLVGYHGELAYGSLPKMANFTEDSSVREGFYLGPHRRRQVDCHLSRNHEPYVRSYRCGSKLYPGYGVNDIDRLDDWWPSASLQAVDWNLAVTTQGGTVYSPVKKPQRYSSRVIIQREHELFLRFLFSLLWTCLESKRPLCIFTGGFPAQQCAGASHATQI